MRDTLLRPDLKIIADLIEPGARVLDVGCGGGELLAWLQEHKQAKGRGIEIDANRVNEALGRGVSVIQGDVNHDLSAYPKQAFDYVILSQSLQMLHAPHEIVPKLLQIGKRAVVSVPNFAHWRNRLYLGWYGKMPVTKTLSYEWYDTPNIHFCTITDFVELCDRLGITIDKRLMVSHHGNPTRFKGKGVWANLFGEQGVFVLSS